LGEAPPSGGWWKWERKHSEAGSKTPRSIPQRHNFLNAFFVPKNGVGYRPPLFEYFFRSIFFFSEFREERRMQNFERRTSAVQISRRSGWICYSLSARFSALFAEKISACTDKTKQVTNFQSL
jgi:hypothetical protein